MTFRFSIIDKDFTIHVNDVPVTIEDLKDLSQSTEFCWATNGYSDDFTNQFSKAAKEDSIALTPKLNVSGFLATVTLPRHLKITGTEEQATVDLFVNGRLREKNITRHIPTQRIVESYLYGQLHFDEMDTPGKDPFTSSREGIIEDDKNFQSLLDYLKKEALPHVLNEWDKLRLDRGKDGDDENTEHSAKKQRKAKSLYTAFKEEYRLASGASISGKVGKWLDKLSSDAEFNISVKATPESGYDYVYKPATDSEPENG